MSEQPESPKKAFVPRDPYQSKTSSFTKSFVGYARLPQRVAMDDLASYFVEERSKVR